MTASEAKEIYDKHFEYGCNVCEEDCEDYKLCQEVEDKIIEALCLLELKEQRSSYWN